MDLTKKDLLLNCNYIWEIGSPKQVVILNYMALLTN